MHVIPALRRLRQFKASVGYMARSLNKYIHTTFFIMREIICNLVLRYHLQSFLFGVGE
jgi:hypothetical protein